MKKALLISVPYFVAFTLTLIFGIVFRRYIEFHILPIIVIAFLLLQVLVMLSRDMVENTNVSSGDLNSKEVYSLMKMIAHVTLCVIPLLFPLAIFCDLKTKAIVACTAWILTFFVGFIAFRVKYGKEIRYRIKEEEKELSEQKKREEHGFI